MTSTRVEHPPVEQQLAKWIAHDGCRTTPTVEKRLIGKGQDAGNTATKLVYAPCSSGANVVLWKLTGSGHVWPGRDAWLTRVLGKPTHLIDANEEMWAFFRSAAPRSKAALTRRFAPPSPARAGEGSRDPSPRLRGEGAAERRMRG